MKWLMVIGAMTAMNCYGVAFSWPYVRGVEVVANNGEIKKYVVDIGRTVINDDDIKAGAKVAAVAEQHGVVSRSTFKYVWGIFYRYRRDGVQWGGLVIERNMFGADKWVSAAEELADELGDQRIDVVARKEGEEAATCFASGLGPPGWSNGPWQQMLNESWGVGGAGDCVVVPPANEWCAMKTPTIEIKYGTMTLEDAEGREENAGVSVECTAGMKYTLRLQDANNETTLDNGGRVTWQAGGKALGKTLTGKAGENGVDLTATLHGPFERTGEFKGSGILFVSYP
ncbi:hypothetical protein [Pantoea ananatis]|uniref:hypothetical protein n=1 Tax=Pantoea ananas TaxID=553 RepID=UPI001C897FE3|nr:hypothetical protein [Pantoea ananatis]QZE28251.1 hypothetical protein K4732_15165 [Pantoea ananatis]